ncbi:DUF2956 domain-containing protein [Vibrio albus]|uniref:DUF2956 domain-containing protein n=1 Tax=Vibrio albus TaxID=2200953 RepID=A0A2U3BCB7_9VIBR|nr:DUF2956 domain-containing protein [Vibrio albus]PWI34428.1 DUF2956 domain-containing protein [Vibrio albus]
MSKKKSTVSAETQTEAMKIAKATQKPGQTKEQTKLVAQGIEKGIAQYKKQQKEKSRQADKAKKKAQKEKAIPHSSMSVAQDTHTPPEDNAAQGNKLPWILLTLSWIGFIGFMFLR